MAKADEVLKELGERLKLGDLKFQDNGYCTLVFDNEHIVDIIKEEDDKDKTIIKIVCPIGDAPTGIERLELYRQMMEGNLFAQGTGGAAIYLDTDIDELMMYDRLVIGCTEYQAFETALEAFLNHLETWKEKLKEYGGGEKEKPAGMTPKGPVSSPKNMDDGPPEGFMKV